MKLTVAAVALLLAMAGAALAHFNLNQNVRVIHVVHQEEHADIYIRTPFPYLVAHLAKPDRAAPFTRSATEDGKLMHYVDWQQLETGSVGLAQLAADSLVLEAGGREFPLQAISARMSRIGTEPPFGTPEEAIVASRIGETVFSAPGKTYAGDAVASLHLRTTLPIIEGRYTLRWTSDPDLPGQEETANLVMDHRTGSTLTFRATGLMTEPLEAGNAPAAAAVTFVVEGIRHILEGLDHVLFVICMVLGAQTFKGLLARVTGFTLGHSVTLAMGFFGIAPSGAWFIPAVETAIAASIVLAAADAVFRPPSASDARAVAATSLIGLLHGFGFSFMLREILQLDAANVWQCLLAFNIGVEAGQLMIVAIAWPLLLLLRSAPPLVWNRARNTLALGVSVLALVWVVERATVLVS